MWLFTGHGFFSVVMDDKDPNRVYVRARLREDINKVHELARTMAMCVNTEDGRLLATTEILETPERDYRFRFGMHKYGWAEVMYRMAESINYTNFKDVIHERDPERAIAYTGVWAQMLHFSAKRQDREAANNP